MHSEKVHIKGAKVTLIQTPSGRWATNFGTSDTREGAIRQAAAGIESENKRIDYQTQEHQAREQERLKHTEECTACHVRVTNMRIHQQSKTHKNNIAYENYRRNSSHRF